MPTQSHAHLLSNLPAVTYAPGTIRLILNDAGTHENLMRGLLLGLRAVVVAVGDPQPIFSPTELSYATHLCDLLERI